jgi:hypothetical protein
MARSVHQVTGTVTNASPLRVRLDGELSDGLAKTLDGKTYVLNDRVAVLVRNPQIPLILGVESS